MLKRKDLQIIFDLIKPNTKVLDLGCGDGSLLKELIQRKGIYGVGIEINITKIKKCVEYGISVIQEDLNEGLKDFDDKSFDYVILSQTLEDILNPLCLTNEMLRVARKCIISFENLAFWKNRISFLLNGTFNSNELNGKILQDGQKQQILTVNKFINFCNHYRFDIFKTIFLPNSKFRLSCIFPNFYSKIAIFVLKSN